jgi:hypothetical protein
MRSNILEKFYKILENKEAPTMAAGEANGRDACSGSSKAEPQPAERLSACVAQRRSCHVGIQGSEAFGAGRDGGSGQPCL